MKKGIFLILIFSSQFLFAQKNELIGTWFCEAGMQVDTNEVYDLSEEDNPINTGVISIDTTYSNFPFLFEIYPNGNFTGFAGKSKSGKWKINEDKIEFSFDSLLFWGKIENNKLILVDYDNFYNSKLILKKIANTKTLNWKARDYKSKNMSVNLNDSLRYSFHFIDRKKVIIDKNYIDSYREISQGEYKVFNYKNYQFLAIDNLKEIETLVFMILDNENSSLNATTTVISTFSKTYESIDCIFKNENLLTNAEISNCKSVLQGEWSSKNEFYPKDCFFDREILTDTYFKLNFLDNKFSIIYGGEGSSGEYQNKISGNWKLGKTGKYLIINYEREFRDMKIDETDYIAVNKISNTLVDITMRLRAIKTNNASYAGINIKLEKIK